MKEITFSITVLLLLYFVGSNARTPTRGARTPKPASTSRGKTKGGRPDVRLFKYLKSAASRAGEPVVPPRWNKQTLRPVNVTVGMQLDDVMTYDEQRKVVKVATVIRIGWFDNNLKWNPRQFGQMRRLLMPSDKLWTPDIRQYPSSTPQPNWDRSVSLQVQNTGKVFWAIPAVMEAPCTSSSGSAAWWAAKSLQADCQLSLSSWMYTEAELNPQLASAAISTQLRNHTVEVTGFFTRRDVGHYTVGSFPSLTFIISIRRQ